MDGNDGAGESRAEQVVKDLRADLSARAVGADDSDDARLEKGAHRRRGGTLRSDGRLLREAVGYGNGQLDVPDPPIDLDRFGETRGPEHVEHLPIVAEHPGVERVDARGARALREVLEEARPDAMPLRIVGHREGDFGTARCSIPAVIARERHDPSATLGNQRHRLAAIHVDERTNPCLGERGTTVKAVVQALRGERLQEPQQRSDVAAARPAHAHGRAVAYDHVRHGVQHRHRLTPRAGWISASASSSGRTSRCDSGSDRGSIREKYRLWSDCHHFASALE
jgi:hypothetical protein